MLEHAKEFNGILRSLGKSPDHGTDSLAGLPRPRVPFHAEARLHKVGDQFVVEDRNGNTGVTLNIAALIESPDREIVFVSPNFRNAERGVKRKFVRRIIRHVDLDEKIGS